MGIFLIGLACGLLVGGCIIGVLMSSDRRISEQIFDVEVAKARNEALHNDRENARLRLAIKQVQTVLADINPPRTEHKVNY